jgi:hypothetical protein
MIAISKKILLFSICCLGLSFLTLQNISANGFTFRKVENKAFNYGERLDYKVGYAFVTAGNGYFQVMPMATTSNNRKCYDIRFRVYSLESLKWIYQVDDSYRTLMDAEGLFPWTFQQRIREGKYKRDVAATFDQVNHKATEKGKTYSVSPYVHDIVSAFYYVRTQNLAAMKNGSVFYLENFFDGKSHKLGVKIHKRETIQVEAGKFKAILIEPLVMQGGLFKSEGHIYIWVSDDELKIPLKVSTKILIGDVYAEMTKYSGLNGKLTSRIG